MPGETERQRVADGEKIGIRLNASLVAQLGKTVDEVEL